MASGVLSQPKGYARHTVGATAVDLRDTPAAGVTLPDGAVSALIQVFTQSVIMRDDGSAATATDGVKIDANEAIIYRGDLEKLSFIRAGGSDGEIRVLFYGAEPPEITADTSAGGGGGAGTEYTEGDTDASITGTALLWEDTGDTLRVPSAAKPLPAEVITSVLPSGAASAANQSTIIGHLDGVETLLTAIQTAVQLIDDAISGAEMQVDVVTSALPSGAATETTLASVKTAVELIDNAISGSEMQVDVVAALPAGTNAIGKLAANSGVDIGDVDVTSQPARAATTDAITAKLATDAIMNGLTALTPKFAPIDAASSGDNTIVAAVSGKKIRVLALFLVAAGTVNVRFESGASGTARTGQMNLVANSGFTLPFNPVGWFETDATTLLNLELSAAISVDGCLTYVEV